MQDLASENIYLNEVINLLRTNISIQEERASLLKMLIERHSQCIETMAKYILNNQFYDDICEEINKRLPNGCNHEYSTNDSIPLQTKEEYCITCISDHFKLLSTSDRKTKGE